MADGTYGDDPANSDVDKVRFLASDRTAPFKMSDKEIEYLIERTGSPESAASAVARSIAGTLSTLADKTVGPLSIKYSEQAKSYFLIATQIDSDNAKGSGGGPILTQTERPPLFAIGMWDNPRDVTLNPYSDFR